MSLEGISTVLMTAVKVRLSKIRTSLEVRMDRLRGKEFVHFLHIGKTGGSAVKSALHRAISPRYRLLLHGHGRLLTDVPAGDKCIFFVRDPLSRFISGFYSRQRQGLPRYRIPWSPGEEDAFQRFASPKALAAALSSSDADIRHAAVAAMNSIQHVRDSYGKWFRDGEYLVSRFSDILFVGSQERLNEDFDRLRELLGLPGDCELPQDDLGAHRNPRGLDTSLDDPAKANLLAWYADDYRLLKALRGRFANLPAYALLA
jgi:hypothetical protein